ncbi:DUF3794 domain-containing protein [Tepidanaerobacter sp. EBM-38]|jgi:hypothetical protein|uniref:DUF3794 domain-containing protein n=1 Tax=Tepidanaerobacter sp. EBM-38 TaxID=1918496 RepID=UPI000A80CEFE|nr:DUF3794 domain-containing protein [Tepidanaerobacter sp. EBM-38]
MELFRTEEVIWEKNYQKDVQVSVDLKPAPIKITDIISRVINVNYTLNEGAIIISAILEIDLYFLDKEGKIHFCNIEKPLEYGILPEKIIKDMNFYIICHSEQQSQHLSGNLLTLNLFVNIGLQGVIEKNCSPFPPKRFEKEKITTFKVMGEKREHATLKSTFEKQDCQHIIIMKPHLSEANFRVLRSAAMLEGEVTVEVFYLSTQGIEKYGTIAVPIEKIVSFAEAEPNQTARITVDYIDIYYKPCGKNNCYDVIITLEYMIKILKKAESQVITDFNEPGYEVVKEEFLLKEVITEGEFAFLEQKSFLFESSIKCIVDLQGKIESISHTVEGGRLVVDGIIGLEIIYADERLKHMYKYIQIDFSNSYLLAQIVEGTMFDINVNIIHLSGALKDETIMIKALIEVAFSGSIRRQATVVTDVLPRDQILQELVSVEKILESKTIDFTEKYEINIDRDLKEIEDVKSEIDFLDVVILDYRFLIQGTLNVDIYYIGTDDIVHCQKSIVPVGILGSVVNGDTGMQIRVNPKICQVSIGAKNSSSVQLFFSLSFAIEATKQEDIYLVTGVRTESVGNYRQVYFNKYVFNINHTMPLISPALFIRDIKVIPNKKRYEQHADGLWAVGKLYFDIMYTGKDKYVYQDFDELDFRFHIKDELNIYKGGFDLEILPSKVFLTSEGQMLESEFQLTIKTYHWENCDIGSDSIDTKSS